MLKEKLAARHFSRRLAPPQRKIRPAPENGALPLPPIVGELNLMFDVLEDGPLIRRLERPGRRGPRGYPIAAFWRAFLAKHHLGLRTTISLLKTLQNNRYIAATCGFDPARIPHEATFSRHFAQLALYRVLAKVRDVSRRLTLKAYDVYPDLARRVAIDSTTLKAWSNGSRRIKSDKDAGWSVKKSTSGRTEAVYGFKLNLMVDVETEFPICANVSAGNVHDSKRASNLLSEARSIGRFKPRFVFADKGYSGQQLFHLIRRQYWAMPMIDINPGHKKLLRRNDEMIRHPEWRSRHSLRASVEHVNGRLKQTRSLNAITTRGRLKASLHCYLAIISLQCWILGRSSVSPS